MNLKNGIKTTFRQLIRLIIYIAFLAILSFGFLSHLLEYQMMSQQVEQAAGYYRPVGHIQPTGDTYGDISDGADLVEASEDVLYSSRHHMIFATMTEGYTPDIDARRSILSGNNICYFTGTLLTKTLNEFDEPMLIPGDTTYTYEYVFYVQVDEIISVLPEYMNVGDKVRVLLYSNGEEDIQEIFDNVEIGEVYLYNVTALLNGRNKVGSENYGFYLDAKNAAMMICKTDFSDISEEERVQIERDMSRQEVNIRGLAVNSLSDVSFSDVATGMFRLLEGRWITQADEEEGRKVCVVHQNMAELRGYSIGDEITIELYDMQLLMTCGILSPFIVGQENYDHWNDVETVAETYEIVGICGLQDRKAVVGSSTVFVPSSSIPQEWRARWKQEVSLTKDKFYFVLEHPDRVVAFMEDYEDDLSEMGYMITFADNGWDKFQEAAQPMLQSALMGALVFGVLMTVSMILLTVLIVLSRRRDMAIMRALGNSQSQTIAAHFWPLFFVGGIGIMTGAGISWRYVNQEAEKLLSGLTSLLASDTSLDISSRLLLVETGSVLLLWAIMLVAFIVLQQHKPVLDQLQGNQSIAKTRKYTKSDASSEEKSSENVGAKSLHASDDKRVFGTVNGEMSGNNGGSSRNLLLRLTQQYVLRTPGRTALIILITCGFVVVLSAMAFYILYNERQMEHLYQTVEVTGSIERKSDLASGLDAGVVPLNVVQTLKSYDSVKRLYLEMDVAVNLVSVYPIPNEDPYIVPYQLTTVRGLKKWEGSTLEQEGLQIEFLEGYDESFLTSQDKRANGWIVMSGKLMDEHGIEMNEEIILRYNQQAYDVLYSYRIIGRLLDEGSETSTTGIVMRSKELECLHTGAIKAHYSAVEFVVDPSENLHITEFQEKVDQLLSTVASREVTQLVCVMDDEELTMAIEPLEQGNRLMEILYPILLAVFVLVSVGVAVLLMLPRRKEAAIMRVLGTRKRHAMTVFVGGHMLTCILGILVALVGMWWVAPWLYKWIWGRMLTCIALSLAGSLAGSLIGAWTLVSGKPLELLQVKE